ncbi:hypothetical protein Tco_1292956 [Tanacetum coccineum]
MVLRAYCMTPHEFLGSHNLLGVDICFLVFTSWDLAYRKVSEAADQAFDLLKVKSVPSGLVSIRPAPDPSTHDDPFINSVYGSCGVSTTDASGRASSGFSTRKSARICPFIDVLGRNDCDRVRLECAAYEIDWRLNYAPFRHQDRTDSSMGGEQACSASGVQWKSLFLMHFFKVLNSGKDLSAELERNLFKLASFPLRLWTSLIVRGDGSHNTAFVFSGHGFIPSGLIMYPKNIPSTALNLHFLGLSFILIFRNVQSVSSITLSIYVSVWLLITNSSTYTSMFRPTWLSKALSTSYWYVAPAFLRPKGILV